ncbi:putative bifunctional diguanylate cyclase/phosphodiesterase [Actinoplanes solisilvae]|uniref:putative bifunctional diguanylate cyclase/phosphodiesterase n=1 Tax=Actinoplanes solisilvae TaxID=2486853 RepID=UPI000FDB7A2D|nr:EAL domain-containing protein [Actinoplanes solisilvae]
MKIAILVAVPAALAVVALVVLPPEAVAGLLTACSGAIAVLMVRARPAGPRLRALALAGGAGLAALAGAASGLTVLFAPEVLVGGVPLPAEIPLVTLFLVAALYLPALLRPQQLRGATARLRVGLDTLGVTACLMFVAWVPLFTGAGERRGASITALIFGSGAVAACAVSGVHALRHRAALQWCGPAAALSLVSLAVLVIAMDFPGQPNAAIAGLAAGLASNVAAAGLWYGSVKISPDAGEVPPPGSETSASFPLLGLAILVSALVTVYHLINGGHLDPIAIMLGAVAITAVATREWVSATVLRRQAGHLTDQGNRLRSLMFGSADVAMILDANLAVRWQSPAAARQFGLSDQEVLGRTVSMLVHADQVDAVEAYLNARMASRGAAEALAVRLRDGFGRWRETEWTTNGADPADPANTLVVHVRDVTRRHDLEQALSQSTHLDRQTGLANHEGLLRAAELTPDAGAMVVVELGGLTAIADVHGRDLAEAVLVEAARRLRSLVAAADVAARLGETRLAVLTHCGAVRAHLLASQLVNALAAPYTAAGAVAHLTAWAGLADLTEVDGNDEAVRRATLALRSVRSGPPGTVEWYDTEMETRLLRRSTLEQDLPGAITRGELDLSYQPVVDLADRRPVGVEALVSWRHPTLGAVPAAELLPLAEDLGLLTGLGHWALHRSCHLLVGWRRMHGDLWLAVNVRPRELADPAFQASLHTALVDHGLPPSALVVEIAEQHLLGVREDAPDVIAQLGRLRAEGLLTSVDDFGTGPTSLSRLRNLPVDLLKIDREMFGLPAETLVLDVAVTLGRRLGMEVVASGVQEPADLEAARSAGCRLGQGDLLGRPMPAERLEALLEHHPVTGTSAS